MKKKKNCGKSRASLKWVRRVDYPWLTHWFNKIHPQIIQFSNKLYQSNKSLRKVKVRSPPEQKEGQSQNRVNHGQFQGLKTHKKSEKWTKKVISVFCSTVPIMLKWQRKSDILHVKCVEVFNEWSVGELDTFL